MKITLSLRFAVAALLVAGCGGGGATPPDAFVPRDAAVVPDAVVAPDASTPDAFTVTDAFVAPDAATDPDAGPAHRILVVGGLMSGTFASTSFPALLATHGAVDTMADAAIDDAVLAPYDLVVFANIPDALSAPERSTLGNWVITHGHSVLVLSGYTAATAERTNTQSILSVFGMHVDPTHAAVSTTPSFAAGAISRGTLTTPPMVSGGNVFMGAFGAGAEVEATGAMGDVAARYIVLGGSGRAFVWLDDYATLDSGWSADTATFWNNVLGWLLP